MPSECLSVSWPGTVSKPALHCCIHHASTLGDIPGKCCGLQEWRVRAVLPARDTVVLDENDGEGWDLAEGLLRAREVRQAF